ncbi:tRNA lysidine(34) synthetase TilS [Corynebacterium aquilae]|uniref:tRNA(Ile)-lysidine synthase n=1 Tax=Corynebacterium aquilae DSM 44791 TaxID=1431546 RepID=A0A1L7CI17_9CORY|nr:tRNA lysidine(34) synthetase TilS [Corynebacterium aquilae]APT85502.1 hypothetical protein CAQU_11065 [Corynebacterium aquilae DSM 44791]
MPAHIGQLAVAYDAPGLNACRRAVRAHLKHHPHARINLGYSGGPDSTALLAALLAENLTVRAIIIDHGIHPEHATITATARSLAEALGAQTHTIAVTLAAGSQEAAAREARYTAFAATSDHIFTGHTLDDQAETLLLGLLRGNATAMQPVSNHQLRIHRPLLGIRRADTHNACRELGLDPDTGAGVNGHRLFIDPTNTDTDYRRADIRQRLLPLLADIIGGDAAPTLATAADTIAASNHLIDTLTPDTRRTHLPIRELAALPPVVLQRTIAQFLIHHGAKPTTGSIHQVTRLVTDWHGQGAVAVAAATPTLGGDRLAVARNSGKLEMSTLPPAQPRPT